MNYGIKKKVDLFPLLRVFGIYHSGGDGSFSETGVEL